MSRRHRTSKLDRSSPHLFTHLALRILVLVLVLAAVAYEWPAGVAAVITWGLLRWAPGGRWLVGVLAVVAIVWGLVGGLTVGSAGLESGGIHAVGIGPPVGIIIGFAVDRWKR